MGTAGMSAPEGSVGPRHLEQDPLVDRLLPDPARNPPDVIVLTGFLGKSARDSHWRIYPTPELDEYLEVDERDIVHREPLAPDENAIGGSRLWVKASAKLVHARLLTHEAQADFLRGEIGAAGAGTLAATDRLSQAVAVYYPRTYQAICAILTYHPDRCRLAR
jgi:hypothetical protein